MSKRTKNKRTRKRRKRKRKRSYWSMKTSMRKKRTIEDS